MDQQIGDHDGLGRGARRGDRLRLFLSCWILFSAHFATNIVREHYPAFALIDHGDFTLDEYAGFHSDIFEHRDGHHYIGNQVTGSLPAVPPLLLFDPILDRLEERSKERAAEKTGGEAEAKYDTEYPLRQEFFKKVKERGLELRFGASAAITSALVMAPLSAWLAVMVFGVLLGRGVARGRALGLAWLFAFATPIFYRTAHLNHNMFVMAVVFGAFLLLWNPKREGEALSTSRRFWAGFLAGTSLALDYAGVVPLLALYGWLVIRRWRQAGFRQSLAESVVFVVGSVPPVAWLCFSQWWMYGHPFLPGQHWMPEVNYTDRGWRGFDWPTPDLFASNLFNLDYGLLAFGPLLAFAFVPALFYRRDALVLSRSARWFVWTFFIVFLTFNAANQYSRMQWNTGFRYLLPLVPLLFLAAADHLARLPRMLLVVLAVPAVLHEWVLCMFRFTPVDFGDERTAVLESWRRLFEEGPQLPWLTVARQTMPDTIAGAAWMPSVLIACSLGVVWVLWRGSRRRFSPADDSGTVA